MFDAPPTTAIQGSKVGAAAENGADLEEDDEDGDGDDDEDGRPQARRETEGKKQGGVAAAVLAMLQQVSEEQVEEISQISRSAPLIMILLTCRDTTRFQVLSCSKLWQILMVVRDTNIIDAWKVVLHCSCCAAANNLVSM